jgi:hypothetical protein
MIGGSDTVVYARLKARAWQFVDALRRASAASLLRLRIEVAADITQ